MPETTTPATSNAPPGAKVVGTSQQLFAVCSDVAAHCNRLDRRARAVFALAPVATVLGGVAGGFGVRLGLQGAWLLVLTGTISGALLATLLWNGVVTGLLARMSVRSLQRLTQASGTTAQPREPRDVPLRWLRALVGEQDLERALSSRPAERPESAAQ